MPASPLYRLRFSPCRRLTMTLDAQLEQLRGAGGTKIYREKVTGAHSNRRQPGHSRDGGFAG